MLDSLPTDASPRRDAEQPPSALMTGTPCTDALTPGKSAPSQEGVPPHASLGTFARGALTLEDTTKGDHHSAKVTFSPSVLKHSQSEDAAAAGQNCEASVLSGCRTLPVELGDLTSSNMWELQLAPLHAHTVLTAALGNFQKGRLIKCPARVRASVVQLRELRQGRSLLDEVYGGLVGLCGADLSRGRRVEDVPASWSNHFVNIVQRTESLALLAADFDLGAPRVLPSLSHVKFLVEQQVINVAPVWGPDQKIRFVGFVPNAYSRPGEQLSLVLSPILRRSPLEAAHDADCLVRTATVAPKQRLCNFAIRGEGQVLPNKDPQNSRFLYALVHRGSGSRVRGKGSVAHEHLRATRKEPVPLATLAQVTQAWAALDLERGAGLRLVKGALRVKYGRRFPKKAGGVPALSYASVTGMFINIAQTTNPRRGRHKARMAWRAFIRLPPCGPHSVVLHRHECLRLNPADAAADADALQRQVYLNPSDRCCNFAEAGEMQVVPGVRGPAGQAVFVCVSSSRPETSAEQPSPETASSGGKDQLDEVPAEAAAKGEGGAATVEVPSSEPGHSIDCQLNLLGVDSPTLTHARRECLKQPPRIRLLHGDPVSVRQRAASQHILIPSKLVRTDTCTSQLARGRRSDDIPAEALAALGTAQVRGSRAAVRAALSKAGLINVEPSGDGTYVATLSGGMRERGRPQPVLLRCSQKHVNVLRAAEDADKLQRAVLPPAQRQCNFALSGEAQVLGRSLGGRRWMFLRVQEHGDAGMRGRNQGTQHGKRRRAVDARMQQDESIHASKRSRP